MFGFEAWLNLLVEGKGQRSMLQNQRVGSGVQ
jgi:hypothetical protein